MKHLRFLLLAFILCELPFVSVAQDTSWYSESETVFTLTTADQILGLRDLVKGGTSFEGKYIKLGNDIDISSTNWYYAIGISSSKPFAGSFDGCNHTIYYKCSSGGNSAIGLFGETVSGSLITRLRVSGSININTSGSSYIGGIAAISNGKITHCINDVSIKTTMSARIGGICGEGRDISYCKNTASITVNTSSNGTFWVGGIAGYRGGNIDHCVNTGGINCSDSRDRRVTSFHAGGICGYPLGASIKYCENTGSVSAKGESVFVGGIGGNSGSTSFSFCRNIGSVYATGYYKSGGTYSNARAGGISGSQSSPTLTFDNCYVASSNISASSGYSNNVGHICGIYVTSMIFNNCYANSDCSFRGSNNDGKQYVDRSYTRDHMMSIDFANKLNDQEYGWIGGEGVFPIPLGSLSATSAYTTYKEPTEISFDNDAIDMPVGDREEVLANVLPLGAYPKLTWESSNPGVVTVDEDGVLWSVGVGNAVITATSVRNNAISATCNVHVGTNDVSSIMLPESIKLKVNESKTIERTIVPSYANYNLTWESANEQVATVDQNGNVTGINIGETEIMVTDNLTNVQATCSVSVVMEVGDTFTADIPNGSGTVSTTFMLTDSENRYVSIGDGSNAAIATATTGSIVIPETIVGPGNLTYTVTSIGSKAFASSKISAVTIPSGITAIGDNAFNGCSSLTSVTVESTEPLAINSTCFSVKAGATLNVPKGCYEAYKATDVWKDFGSIVEPLHTNGDTFAASITAGSSTTKATFVVVDAANKYVSVGNGEESAIADYTSGNIVIPSTVKGYDGQTYQVKQISDAAFFDCYEVTSFQLPDGIISIGRVAFYDCAGLTSFTIPATVTSIDEEAFNNCYNLTSINIPASVTSLGVAAFVGCSKLTSVTVNWNEPIAIDDECFTNAANATLNIPKGTYMNYATADNWKNFITIKEPAHSVGDSFMASITAGGTKVDATFKVTNTTNKYVSIGDGEDSAIDIFTSGNIVIPSTVKGYDGQTYTVKTVADAAFFGCENMSSVSLPSGLTGIGNSSFLRCYYLASINIPTSLTKIGSEAFFYCGRLTSISIPKNVTSIGARAFKNCSQLTFVTVNWVTPITIDNECFSNAANATLNVPYGSKERYEAATGWKQIKNIVERAPKDGDVFTALTAEDVKMTFTIISASAKTCKVGDGSSASISTSTDGLVTIPTTANGFAVTQISSKAFYNCNQITATEIPTSISSIGTYAFSGCNNLTSVTVGWDEPISIGTTCFSNAANATLYVPAGCKSAYEAADVWKTFRVIWEEDTDISTLDNVLYVESKNIFADGLNAIYLKMKNSVEVAAIEFDLELPEGMSYDTMLLTPNRVTNRTDFTPSITPITERKLHVFYYPNSSDAYFSGTDGDVARITIETAEDLAIGDYPLILRNIEISGRDGKPYTSSYVKSTLTVVDGILGDVNNSGNVSVADIVGIVNYKSGREMDNFHTERADVNGDGSISVADIVGIVNTIVRNARRQKTPSKQYQELDPQ